MVAISSVMTQVQAGINSMWKPTQDLTKIGTVSRGQSLFMGESGDGGAVGFAASGAASGAVACVGEAGRCGDAGAPGLVLPAVFWPAWLTAQSGKLGGSGGV